MKNKFFFLFSALIITGLMIQGFDCGSSNLVGARVYIKNQKDYKSAIPLLEKETQKNPTNSEAWYLLGMSKGMLDDYKGMNIAFDECLKISISYTDDIRRERYGHWANHINAAVPYMKKDSLQNFDRAVEEYKSACTAWPDTSLTYDLLARAYASKGDIDNAVINFKKAWDLGRDIESYKNVGRYFVQHGLDKKEEFKSTNADELKLKNNLDEVNKGSYKSDVTRNFGAPDNVKKDKKNPKREDWIYNKYAMTLAIEGDRVVNKNMEKPYVFKIDSTKYYEAVVDFNKAVDVFEAIKTAAPKDNVNLNLLLQAYYEANRIKEATSAFKLAVDNDPGSKMNHYILGLLYKQVDDYEGAIAEFKAAINIDPNFTDALYDIGATYYNWGVRMKKVAQEKQDESTEYKKMFQESLPWMEKVAKIRENDVRIWDTLGTIYMLLGQTDKATKALDEADRIRKSGK